MAVVVGDQNAEKSHLGLISNGWKTCNVCDSISDPSTRSVVFRSPEEFCEHLEKCHCSQEGGSFVCQYGINKMCQSLPLSLKLQGVCDREYHDHVARDHVRCGSEWSNSEVCRTKKKEVENTSMETPNTEQTVMEANHKWTPYSSQVNLPAVLNDPRLTRRQLDFFTKTWGEEFDHTAIMPSDFIPQIKSRHFTSYKNQVSKCYALRKKDSLKAENNQANHRKAPCHNSIRHQHFPSRLANSAEAQAVETIPKIFMDSNFSLENTDTFNTVFPWSNTEFPKDRTEKNSGLSSKLLQEKLGHYLDIVEVHIARQIADQSEAFFHAVTSHDVLQDHLCRICDATKKLRKKIQFLDKKLIEGPLKIMQLRSTRGNYSVLYDKLKLMATVQQTQPTIQLLLSTCEFVGALDLIATSQEVLSLELAGVHCFRHLGSQLAEMEKMIEKMMQEEFVQFSNSDLIRPLSEGSHLVNEEHMVTIVLGMLRQHKYTFVDLYREEANAVLAVILKETVIKAVTKDVVDDTEANTGSLNHQMRLLNYEQWMDMLQEVFSNLLVILDRVKTVSDVLVKVVQVAAGRKPCVSTTTTESIDGTTSAVVSAVDEQPAPVDDLRVSLNIDVDVLLSEAESIKITSNLRHMVHQVCNHAHDRCAKLLLARAKDGFLERLSSSEFLRLSRSIEEFVNTCESISSHRSTSLQGGLHNQACKFVTRFHKERKIKLSLILDNERWKQADVPTEFQDLVDYISTTGDMRVPVKTTERIQKARECLRVDEQNYVVVGTVLMLLKMVVEYSQCASDISSAAPDILTRLTELLKTFNSRTCQLILGAGALQLVGLKTITTKNLALASRCLQLIVHFLPIVRQHFHSKLQGKHQNVLKHFDHVPKDYNDHIAEIANKLVTLMENKLESNLAKWEVKAPVPSDAFRNVCKQMSKLHQAIFGLLPAKQVQGLFLRVHTGFKRQLTIQVNKLGVINDGGPQHGLVQADIAFYQGNLKSIVELTTEEICMDNIWERS